MPAYRGPFDVEVLGTFSGPFGSGLRNAPIPSIGFPSKYREGALFKITFTQSVAEIEALSHSTDTLAAPWPANAIAYTNTLMVQGKVSLYEGLGLQEARRVVSPGLVVSVVDAVRTRILDLALTIERTDPSTGQAGSPPLPLEARQTIITNIYGGSQNVAVASTDFAQTVYVPPGDRDSLTGHLADLGVAQADIEDLLSALDSDEEKEGADLGPATSKWLAQLMVRSKELGIGAAGSLIASAIWMYLGPH